MGHPAEKRQRPATYADLEAVPEHLVAEIVGDVLYTFSRPGPAHTRTAGRLGAILNGPFDMGMNGPGGWIILGEPELHLGREVLVPDLAGWRVDRLPREPEEAYITVAPDWVCEILSPSTATHDRKRKMPVYAAASVPWVWLIDPLKRVLQVLRLGPGGVLEVAQELRGEDRVRAMPFDAIEVSLSALWPRWSGLDP
ncbi:Uma2 family endonuclease [Chondromyces apiculatus]|nr:Uma2 family endonuclease [Chondromyces apiculatus]